MFRFDYTHFLASERFCQKLDMHTTCLSLLLFPDTQRPFCPKPDPEKSSLCPRSQSRPPLLLRKQVSCWLNPGRPDCPVGARRCYGGRGISLFGVQLAEIRFMFVHTQKENLLATISLTNPTSTRRNRFKLLTRQTEIGKLKRGKQIKQRCRSRRKTSHFSGLTV